MERYIFTSESVTKGHPDKVCDMISDSILDAYLKKDKNARVAVETVVKNNTVVLAGEVSSLANVEIEKTVRQTINSIGYDRPELGFDGHSAEIIQLIDKQSPDNGKPADYRRKAHHSLSNILAESTAEQWLLVLIAFMLFINLICKSS